MNREELIQRLAEIRARLEELRSTAESRTLDRSESDEIDDLMAEHDRRKRELREVDDREVRLRALERDGHKGGELGSDPGRRVVRTSNESRDAALRAIERHTPVMDARAADRLEDLVERDVDGPGGGIDARYIAAMGSLEYRKAFGKVLANPTDAHLRFTPEEHEAWQGANRAMAERAMAEGSSGTGGYGVPFALDPTFMLTNNGAINPIRELAQIRTVTTSEWRGISTAGITASFDAEAAEVSDDSPTLVQPTANVEMARAFVPFSIEVGMDYPGFLTELSDAISDARDVLESSKFATGAGHGSHEPEGIITGATVLVTTGSSAVFAYADVYSTTEALPARWQTEAVWLSSGTVLDAAWKFVAAGDTSNAPIMDGPRGKILGRQTREWSSLSTSLAAGQKIAVFGAVRRAFTIVDRVGLTIELIPHLFATANNLPSGQRGVWAHWRTTSKVLIPDALRVLKVKDS
jgi:HK97 family phage major capsid protein